MCEVGYNAIFGENATHIRVSKILRLTKASVDDTCCCEI